MCGIVGYIGNNNAKTIVLNGLKRLEYRGYDSAGMSLLEKGTYQTFKEKGRITNLERAISIDHASLAIGHTRWATHGKVSVANAHPHTSSSGRFIVVHNGVIDNHQSLKERYFKTHTFKSETDTEVLAELIDVFAENKDVDDAIRDVLSLIDGSYALLIADQENPGTLYAAKYKSPLLIGHGANGSVVGSDMVALIGESNTYMSLDDQTFVRVGNHEIQTFDLGGNPLKNHFIPFELDYEDAQKGAYPHYMLKEIHEQPAVIRRILQEYYGTAPSASIDPELLNHMRHKRLYIVAAGTSMHAGLIGKVLIETLAKQPCEVHIASEFAHNPPFLDDNAFFIMISQSGETADLRAALLNIKQENQAVLTLSNVPTSTLARESDFSLSLHAGPEIAVASTKAYVAQLGVLAILANALGGEPLDMHTMLSDAAVSMEGMLEKADSLEAMPPRILTKRNAFYIGRGLDYGVALEAALKLKEISYIQTEGFAAGELKHGTLALIEDDTPVIAIITDKNVAANTRSNLSEVEARGAKTFTITTESLASDGDDVILRDVHPLLTPLISIIPTQLISYYAAKMLGNDIDKPRNLAKSVTVE